MKPAGIILCPDRMGGLIQLTAGDEPENLRRLFYFQNNIRKPGLYLSLEFSVN